MALRASETEHMDAIEPDSKQSDDVTLSASTVEHIPLVKNC